MRKKLEGPLDPKAFGAEAQRVIGSELNPTDLAKIEEIATAAVQTDGGDVAEKIVEIIASTTEDDKKMIPEAFDVTEGAVAVADAEVASASHPTRLFRRALNLFRRLAPDV